MYKIILKKEKSLIPLSQKRNQKNKSVEEQMSTCYFHFARSIKIFYSDNNSERDESGWSYLTRIMWHVPKRFAPELLLLSEHLKKNSFPISIT